MLNIARTLCTSGKLVSDFSSMYMYMCDIYMYRWSQDKTVHVQLTGRAHRTYRAKLDSVIGRCEERLQWLKKGSRQLFGTLLESRVVIIIDTSSSVKERLDLIKNKVEELLQVSLKLRPLCVMLIVVPFKLKGATVSEEGVHYHAL